MSVMHIWHVGMLVPQAAVRMNMRMWLAGRIIRAVLVLMVDVVHMRV